MGLPQGSGTAASRMSLKRAGCTSYDGGCTVMGARLTLFAAIETAGLGIDVETFDATVVGQNADLV